jgi:glycerophosphoryl diester phosphodiesterase
MVYVVGHRGAAGEQPENTLTGFRYALDLGVDFVECDVHLTRDGRLVVMHDATVDRTTNGQGAISALSLARIRSLDAGDGEQVPTFDEVLDLVAGRAPLLCELKGNGVEEAAVAAVADHSLEDQVIFTSFSLDRLATVRQLGDHYRLGAILPNASEIEIARAVALGAEAIGVRYTNLCYRILAQAHEAGLQVRAWNPDTLAEQQAMIVLGVDGISTNRPSLLLEYLRGAQDASHPAKLPKHRTRAWQRARTEGE